MKPIVIKPLEAATHAVFYKKGLEGYRKLESHQNRISKVFGGCSHELFWDKIFPPPEPGNTIMPKYNPKTGVFTPFMGKAVAGTFIHEALQHYLFLFGFKDECDDFRYIKSEFEVNISFGRVEIDGHVDLVYLEGGTLKICDIKSLAPKTFGEIVGESSLVPGSYAALKREKSHAQANAYALSVPDVDYFTIMWIDRNSLNFRIEEFDTDVKLYDGYLNSYIEVDEKIENFKNGDVDTRPRLHGVQMCNYCGHYNVNCPGLKLLRDMGF